MASKVEEGETESVLQREGGDASREGGGGEALQRLGEREWREKGGGKRKKDEPSRGGGAHKHNVRSTEKVPTPSKKKKNFESEGGERKGEFGMQNVKKRKKSFFRQKEGRGKNQGFWGKKKRARSIALRTDSNRKGNNCVKKTASKRERNMSTKKGRFQWEGGSNLEEKKEKGKSVGGKEEEGTSWKKFGSKLLGSKRKELF